MTEIIDNLHQIGAHELEEIENADLVIDVGGIMNRQYSLFLYQEDLSLDRFKEKVNVPILSYELDEVDDDVVYMFENKANSIEEIVNLTSNLVEMYRNIYVLCLAGQNRSGLIIGLILKDLGWTGEEAVSLIQDKRENALNNDMIRNYLLGEESR